MGSVRERHTQGPPVLAFYRAPCLLDVRVEYNRGRKQDVDVGEEEETDVEEEVDDEEFLPDTVEG